MELKDFTEKEQEQINQGLSTTEISDKEEAKKLLALVPQEWIKRIPFFVREGMRRQRRLNVWLCAILNSMPWPSAKETYLKKRTGEELRVIMDRSSLKKR